MYSVAFLHPVFIPATHYRRSAQFTSPPNIGIAILPLQALPSRFFLPLDPFTLVCYLLPRSLPFSFMPLSVRAGQSCRRQASSHLVSDDERDKEVPTATQHARNARARARHPTLPATLELELARSRAARRRWLISRVTLLFLLHHSWAWCAGPVEDRAHPLLLRRWSNPTPPRNPSLDRHHLPLLSSSSSRAPMAC